MKLSPGVDIDLRRPNMDVEHCKQNSIGQELLMIPEQKKLFESFKLKECKDLDESLL